MGQDVESKVQELESRYRLMADNLIDAIWVLDVAEERYDFITPSVVKLSGETAEKFKQYTLKQIMTPESYKQAKQVMESGVANFEQGQDHKRTLEVEMLHKDGHTYWLEITAKFFRDKDGRLKIAGVSKDISKRKQAEFQREHLIKELSKTLAEKEALLEEIKLLRGSCPFAQVASASATARANGGLWTPMWKGGAKPSSAIASVRIALRCFTR